MRRIVFFVALCLCTLGAASQRVPTSDPPQYGPYNGAFLPDGLGLRFPLKNQQDTLLLPDSPWTLSCWYRSVDAASGLELLAGVGDVTSEYPRFLALQSGSLILWNGRGNQISGPAPSGGGWHLSTATFDGTQFRLYSDGAPIAAGVLTLGTATPILQMAPIVVSPAQAAHFGGRIASFLVLRRALSAAEVKELAQHQPAFDLLSFDQGSKPWPLQTRGQAGYDGPQDPGQVPTSRSPLGAPVAIKRPPAGPSLTPRSTGEWTFSDGWALQEAPKVKAPPSQVASASYTEASGWMRATVPGTVLTTMVDDGIYPDPYYGLNNLAIPESLNKQDYWYRNEFDLPAAMRSTLKGANGQVQLTFEGINYAAEVWLNGSRLGSVRGAFQRGVFDATPFLKQEGKNVLAVRISPPPHPGIPNEQSLLGGPGENGGAMVLDGPTFSATEGWDWIPAIRDRDSGIWQPVTLRTTGQLHLGDTQVIPAFQHHDTSAASLTVVVPIRNAADHPLEATVEVTIDSIVVRKHVTAPPGASIVQLAPPEFPELNLQHPRLWWPNGYGRPELYTARIELHTGEQTSSGKDVRFGVREISYELSLLDKTGHLQRVEFTPAAARNSQTPIVDVSHSGMLGIPGADAVALGIPENHRDDYQYRSVVSSLAPGGDASPAIEFIKASGSTPYLTIKVNGVRIAVRGGNWGMDDAMKRVSRAHLEPYFRLHRDAHMNIIRNWMGQDTEETFYELADEYGLMIWNDFWESTQNYNLEAEDAALFLDNAADTIRRFRNHPSIVMWCGRNEGVPQPILNGGLEELVRTLDGTRYYSPSSNQVNLQQSGPYSYQDPALYFTTLNRGFSVETGTPSMSTLESFESTTPKADQWPIDDVWAYHDWHASGNGRTGTFMAEIEAEFGAATSLPDFERKAQMLNYVDHRAIFEGMNANLWEPNSGRMLWMTQPAWPSTMWQILSSDYDTQASFYGTQKGAEPVHVQLNLANHQVDLVNTTTSAFPGVNVSAKVYSLTNVLLLSKSEPRDLGADQRVHSFFLELAPLLAKGMVLVELSLTDSGGKELSCNLYWLGAKPEDYRELGSLPTTPLQVTATATQEAGETVISIRVANQASVPALNNKFTLFNAAGGRILPAYYSDNYISLLPGESRTVLVHFPRAMDREAQVALRGWNASPQTIRVALPH